MQITDVRIRKVEKEGKMKAVVSITIDEEFVVHDIKIIEGEKGLFIAMPSRKAADGEYRDIAHPINSETRDRIQKLILEKYQERYNSIKFTYKELQKERKAFYHNIFTDIDSETNSNSPLVMGDVFQLCIYNSEVLKSFNYKII